MPPVLLIPWQIATGVVDTGSKFAAGIVDTGGKFATGINNIAKLVAKFAAGVADTGGKFATGVVDTGGNFATGIVDTGGAPLLSKISANFRKKFEMVLMGYSGAGGKLIHEKNQKQKIS